MPESVKKEYLIGILNEIEKKTAFLLARKALCSFHIDGVMASIILRDSKIKNLIGANKFIRLAISTTILYDGIRESGHFARELSQLYPIWLNDFSANPTSFSAIRNIRFALVKMTNETFKEYGHSVMFFSLIETITNYCDNICIEGVETFAQLTMLKQRHITYIKGSLFSGGYRFHNIG